MPSRSAPLPRGSEWWAHQDSNLGPSGYEPPALTTELWAPDRSGKLTPGPGVVKSAGSASPDQDGEVPFRDTFCDSGRTISP